MIEYNPAARNSESFAHEQYLSRVFAGDYPENPQVPLPPAFTNDVGSIQNLTEIAGIGCVQVIATHPGELRSNHFHRTDWHFLYVAAGSALYFWRKVGDEQQPAVRCFRAGEMFFTPPMVEHAVVAVGELVLVSLSRRPRDHASHEEDVVRPAAPLVPLSR